MGINCEEREKVEGRESILEKMKHFEREIRKRGLKGVRKVEKCL